MKFSIIIPVYNAEHTIDRALKSVIAQNYNDFEVIIVNDGSKDNTESICKKYAVQDSRFKYFHQENSGVSSARNKGLDNASGEFVIFLDSDDAYCNNYLSSFAKMISEHNEFDNFWCGYISVETDSASHFSLDSTNKVNISFSDRRTVDLLPALWNKAYRKSIIDQYNLRMPEDVSLGEDLIFNIHYLDASNAKICESNEILYLYTVSNSNSLDGKFRKDLLDIYIRLEQAMYSAYIKWQVDEQQFLKYYSYVFYNRILAIYNVWRPECTLSKKEKLKFSNNILKSKDFKSAMQKSKCHIHPLYKFAYKIEFWQLVRCFDKLVKIKKSLKRGS